MTAPAGRYRICDQEQHSGNLDAAGDCLAPGQNGLDAEGVGGFAYAGSAARGMEEWISVAESVTGGTGSVGVVGGVDGGSNGGVGRNRTKKRGGAIFAAWAWSGSAIGGDGSGESGYAASISKRQAGGKLCGVDAPAVSIGRTGSQGRDQRAREFDAAIAAGGGHCVAAALWKLR